VGLAFLGQDAKVQPAVVVDEEDVLPVVAPLRHVVSAARNDDSGDSRHDNTLHAALATVNGRMQKWVTVPNGMKISDNNR
jgi:hypothetical protein